MLEKPQPLGTQPESIIYHLEVFLMHLESSLLQVKPIIFILYIIPFLVLINFFLRRTGRTIYYFSLGQHFNEIAEIYISPYIAVRHHHPSQQPDLTIRLVTINYH